MKAADPFTGTPTIERQPGQFARHAKTGAPYVAHPTETTKHTGNKAHLLNLCAQRGIDWRSDLDIDPGKTPTIADLQHLLGPRPTKVMYGRPSSLGKQVENQTNLQKWSERAVALGIFLDPSLLDSLADADTNEHMNLDDPDARELLDKVAVRAKSTAQASLAADRGTHHHELTEDHDNERDPVERMAAGETLGVPIEVQTALVAAWAKMLDTFDIEILATEATCVDDVWRQAGTLDRICRLRRELRFITVTGEYVTLPAGWVGILDIKTGKLRLDRSGFVSYWHGYSVQLASYQQSVAYDPDTDTRTPWPWDIDNRWAIIAHLDVLAALEGEAVCRLVLVDLEAGRHAGNLCVAARDWEKRTDVFSIPTDDLAVRVPVTIVTAGSSPLPAVAPAVTSAPTPAPVPPRAAPGATESESTMAAHGADVTPPATPGLPLPVETQQAGAVPPSTAPAEHSPLRAAQLTRQRQLAQADANRRLHGTPDEGDMSDDGTFRSLRKRYDDLTDPQRSWIAALGREAEEAGVGFSSKTAKTVRRWEILRALVFLAARDETDTQVRQWLTLVDRRIEQLDTIPLGHIVGSLHAHEAATFAKLVTDELRPVINDDGTTTLVAA